MLYAAYGSNMNRRQMAKRCPGAVIVAAGFILDHKLVMRRVADIAECELEATPAVLWRLTKQCWQSLDRYEGFPVFYKKKFVRVDRGETVENAIAYVMNRGRPFFPASGAYLAGIVEGYREHAFDTAPINEAQRLAAKEVWTEHERHSSHLHDHLAREDVSRRNGPKAR